MIVLIENRNIKQLYKFLLCPSSPKQEEKIGSFIKESLELRTGDSSLCFNFFFLLACFILFCILYFLSQRYLFYGNKHNIFSPKFINWCCYTWLILFFNNNKIYNRKQLVKWRNMFDWNFDIESTLVWSLTGCWIYYFKHDNCSKDKKECMEVFQKIISSMYIKTIKKYIWNIYDIVNEKNKRNKYTV